ncbi:putative non-specific serine/threonine protein kinase [Helianthus debilis subsp. tardiflorus]
MKSFLKKLHIRSNQSSSPNELNKPLSSITGWLKRSQTQSPKSTGGVDQEEVGVEEEYQIQLALELSAKEDPEAVQIEAVKEISLGSSDPLAARYWNYSALSYDDKIVDGFYDLYGVLSGPTSSKMPSLVDLQSTPVSDNVTWEAVLVNKATDSKLLELEQMALEMAVKLMSESIDSAGQNLVQRLAVLVSDHMGGPVRNPENMVIAWRDFSSRLTGTIGSMVLPLGSLKIGLARHRALLFKVFPFRLSSYLQVMGCLDVHFGSDSSDIE